MRVYVAALDSSAPGGILRGRFETIVIHAERPEDLPGPPKNPRSRQGSLAVIPRAAQPVCSFTIRSVILTWYAGISERQEVTSKQRCSRDRGCPRPQRASDDPGYPSCIGTRGVFEARRKLRLACSATVLYKNTRPLVIVIGSESSQ